MEKRRKTCRCISPCNPFAQSTLHMTLSPADKGSQKNLRTARDSLPQKRGENRKKQSLRLMSCGGAGARVPLVSKREKEMRDQRRFRQAAAAAALEGRERLAAAAAEEEERAKTAHDSAIHCSLALRLQRTRHFRRPAHAQTSDRRGERARGRQREEESRRASLLAFQRIDNQCPVQHPSQYKGLANISRVTFAAELEGSASERERERERERHVTPPSLRLRSFHLWLRLSRRTSFPALFRSFDVRKQPHDKRLRGLPCFSLSPTHSVRRHERQPRLLRPNTQSEAQGPASLQSSTTRTVDSQ